MREIAPPLRFRRVLLVHLLPVLGGAALLLLVVLADQRDQQRGAYREIRGWAGHDSPGGWALLAVVLIGLALVIGVLVGALEWYLTDTRPSRRRPAGVRHALAEGAARIARTYGLDAAAAWPRLYLVLDRPTRSAVEQRRDLVDGATRGSAAAAVVVIVAVWATLPEWRLSALPLLLVPAALAVLLYRAAVRAATDYALAVGLAFELHRFSLLTALHLDLPADHDEEVAINDQLSEWWVRGQRLALPYRHRDVAPDVLDRVEDAVKEALDPPTPVAFQGVVEVTLQGARSVEEQGRRHWEISVASPAVLAILVIVGPDGAARADRASRDWENPRAIATEFVNVRGRSAPRVEVDIDIDAPFVEVSEARYTLDLASDEDYGEWSTRLVVPRPERYDLLVSLFSSGRLVQAVPIELMAVA